MNANWVGALDPRRQARLSWSLRKKGAGFNPSIVCSVTVNYESLCSLSMLICNLVVFSTLKNCYVSPNSGCHDE